MLKKLAHHPAMNVAVGIIMIVSALGEMAGETMGIKLGAHRNDANRAAGKCTKQRDSNSRHA